MRDLTGVTTLYLLGGTILSVAGQADMADRDSLLRSAGIDAGGSGVEIAPLGSVGSQNLTLANILALGSDIAERAGQGGRRFVVVQGTDTMEETAFLLSLTLPVDAVLVLTGAMRTADAAGAEGPGNLADALLAARALEGHLPGTFVCMGGELHAARFVRKIDAGRIGAFASPGFGPVATVVTGRVRVFQRPLPTPGPCIWPLGRVVPRVALLSLGLDADPLQVRALADPAWDGLVVEAMGSGHVPQPLAAPLIAIAATRPVVLVSRCGAGDTDGLGTYQGEGTAAHLLAHGLIDGGWLDGRKARLLLTMLLAQPDGTDAVRAALADWAATGLLG